MSVSLTRVKMSLHCLSSALLLAGVCGCGQAPAPAPADEEQARQTLDRVLASWQKGETIATMKNGSPSILVSDPSWDRGQALKKFEVQGKGKPAGAEREFNVTLWLGDSRGKDAQQSVVYRVGTNPVFTVFRSLF